MENTTTTTSGAAKVKLTDAQITALETAGVFEIPEGDEVLLAAALNGRTLVLFAGAASIVNDLSNAADEIARELGDDERAAWYRTDSRVLANLYAKILRTEAGR